MKRTHPAFWGAGLAGLFVGGLLALLGLAGASEFANMYGGYGLMLMGSAVYLLGGLGLRETLGRRANDVREPRAPRLPASPVGSRN